MAMARPGPQVMRLTDAAADRIKAIIAKADKPIAGVRVGVKKGGCARMSDTMKYAEEAAKFDEVVEDKGVKLLIDPKAVLFLLGTEMDFKVDKLSSTFVFNNPNQTSACGCGESVQLKPDAETIPEFEQEGLSPFTYATKDGEHKLTSYWRMPERLYDDPEELAQWARRAHAAAMRAAARKEKPKKAKKPVRRLLRTKRKRPQDRSRT